MNFLTIQCKQDCFDGLDGISVRMADEPGREDPRGQDALVSAIFQHTIHLRDIIQVIKVLCSNAEYCAA